MQAPQKCHLCLCRLLICAQHAIWREEPSSRVWLIKQSPIAQFYTRHLQKDIIVFGCLVSLGVTSLSREKILASLRSDSHSHRIQLWNANQHPSLFTMWKICHKSRHILTNFVHKKNRHAISDTNNAFHLCLTVFRCPKSTRASIDLNIAEQVFACCSPLTTFSWELYLEFERASYGKHLKGSHKPAVADSLTLEWIGIQQNRFERLLFQLSAITRVVGEARVYTCSHNWVGSCWIWWIGASGYIPHICHGRADGVRVNFFWPV